jgi:hypothetical protein
MASARQGGRRLCGISVLNGLTSIYWYVATICQQVLNIDCVRLESEHGARIVSSICSISFSAQV